MAGVGRTSGVALTPRQRTSGRTASPPRVFPTRLIPPKPIPEGGQGAFVFKPADQHRLSNGSGQQSCSSQPAPARPGPHLQGVNWHSPPNETRRYSTRVTHSVYTHLAQTPGRFSLVVGASTELPLQPETTATSEAPRSPKLARPSPQHAASPKRGTHGPRCKTHTRSGLRRSTKTQETTTAPRAGRRDGTARETLGLPAQLPGKRGAATPTRGEQRGHSAHPNTARAAATAGGRPPHVHTRRKLFATTTDQKKPTRYYAALPAIRRLRSSAAHRAERSRRKRSPPPPFRAPSRRAACRNAPLAAAGYRARR